jgi:hypothetical protein
MEFLITCVASVAGLMAACKAHRFSIGPTANLLPWPSVLALLDVSENPCNVAVYLNKLWSAGVMSKEITWRLPMLSGDHTYAASTQHPCRPRRTKVFKKIHGGG